MPIIEMRNQSLGRLSAQRDIASQWSGRGSALSPPSLGSQYLSYAAEAPWIARVFLGSTQTASGVAHNLFHISPAYNPTHVASPSVGGLIIHLQRGFRRLQILYIWKDLFLCRICQTFNYSLGNVTACDVNIHVILVLKCYVFIFGSKCSRNMKISA